MPMQKKSPDNVHCKCNSWTRGNGSHSMRGELKRGISRNKKRLNRKVRHKNNIALQHTDYKQTCRTLNTINFT